MEKGKSGKSGIRIGVMDYKRLDRLDTKGKRFKRDPGSIGYATLLARFNQEIFGDIDCRLKKYFIPNTNRSCFLTYVKIEHSCGQVCSPDGSYCGPVQCSYDWVPVWDCDETDTSDPDYDPDDIPGPDPDEEYGPGEDFDEELLSHINSNKTTDDKELTYQELVDLHNRTLANNSNYKSLNNQFQNIPSWMWPIVRELGTELVVAIIKKQSGKYVSIPDDFIDAMKEIAQGDLLEFLDNAKNIAARFNIYFRVGDAILNTGQLGYNAGKIISKIFDRKNRLIRVEGI